MQGSIQLVGDKIYSRDFVYNSSPQRPPAVIGTKYVATPATVLFPEIVSSDTVGRYELKYQEKNVLRVYCKNTADADSPGIGTYDDPITSFAQAVKFCRCLNYLCKCGFEYLQIIILPESEIINLSDLNGYLNAKMLLIVGDMDAETKTEAYWGPTFVYNIVLANIELKNITQDIGAEYMYRCIVHSDNKIELDYAIECEISCKILVIINCFACSINCNVIMGVWNGNKRTLDLIANSTVNINIHGHWDCVIETISCSTINASGANTYGAFVQNIFFSDIKIGNPNYSNYHPSLSVSKLINSVITFDQFVPDFPYPIDPFKSWTFVSASNNAVISNSTITASAVYNYRLAEGPLIVGIKGVALPENAQYSISGLTCNLQMTVNLGQGTEDLRGYKYTCDVFKKKSGCIFGCSYSQFGTGEMPDFSCDKIQ